MARPQLSMQSACAPAPAAVTAAALNGDVENALGCLRQLVNAENSHGKESNGRRTGRSSHHHHRVMGSGEDEDTQTEQSLSGACHNPGHLLEGVATNQVKNVADSLGDSLGGQNQLPFPTLASLQSAAAGNGGGGGFPPLLSAAGQAVFPEAVAAAAAALAAGGVVPGTGGTSEEQAASWAAAAATQALFMQHVAAAAACGGGGLLPPPSIAGAPLFPPEFWGLIPSVPGGTTLLGGDGGCRVAAAGLAEDSAPRSSGRPSRAAASAGVAQHRFGGIQAESGGIYSDDGDEAATESMDEEEEPRPKRRYVRRAPVREGGGGLEDGGGHGAAGSGGRRSAADRVRREAVCSARDLGIGAPKVNTLMGCHPMEFYAQIASRPLHD